MSKLMSIYMATVLTGLEPVLADEIRQRIPDAHLISCARGKVLFKSQQPLTTLMTLRTADNIYRRIGEFTAGLHKSHLAELEKQVARFDLSSELPAGKPTGSYIVNASRRGDHTFSRFEAADAAMRAIARRYPGWIRGSSLDHTHEFRLDLMDDQAVFSLRLTDSSFRYRTASRSFAPAALLPTVAHALVRLSQPLSGDVFIDVCCGSGTLIAERAVYPYTRLLGGDLSGEAVRTARSNLPPLIRKGVRMWDAREIPLPSGIADVVVSNLPFGRQIGERDELTSLYRDMVQEMARVLKPGGRAVLLTEDGALLRQAAESCSLSSEELLRLSLKGIHPAIYKLRKESKLRW